MSLAYSVITIDVIKQNAIGEITILRSFLKTFSRYKTNHKDMLATWEYYQEKMFDVYLQIPTYEEIQLRILETNSIRKYRIVVLL